MTTSESLPVTAGSDPLADTSNMTIGEILQTVGDFSVLAAAVDEAALNEALNGPGPYTLFAPTDEAFAVLPPTIRETLLADPALLTEILRYHLVADLANAARLTELGGAPSLAAQPLTISVAATGELQVNDALIVRRDISATNGIIHVINRVLTPPDVALAIPPATAITLAESATTTTSLETLASSDTSGQTILEILRTTEGLSIAAAAVDSAGLSEAMTEAGPFTLLVPTDEAFAALGEAMTTTLNNTQASADLIQTHLIADLVPAARLVELGAVFTTNGQTLDITVGAEDGQIFINGVPVSQVDIETSNGIIHILSAVIEAAP
jgi:transforming growth factor-beta-induced protein